MTFVSENDDSNVEVVKFRTTPFDAWETFVNYICGGEDYAVKPDNSKKNSVTQELYSIFINFIEWPIIIGFVLAIVLLMRRDYCVDMWESSYPIGLNATTYNPK